MPWCGPFIAVLPISSPSAEPHGNLRRFLSAAAVSSYLPARAAAMVNPVEALRSE